jgi:hypothetical protein
MILSGTEIILILSIFYFIPNIRRITYLNRKLMILEKPLKNVIMRGNAVRLPVIVLTSLALYYQNSVIFGSLVL